MSTATAALRADLDRARLALATELGRAIATTLATEVAHETDSAVRFTFEAVPNNLGIVCARLVAAETASGHRLDRDAFYVARTAAWDHEDAITEWFTHLAPDAGDTITIEAPTRREAITAEQAARRLTDLAATTTLDHVDDRRAFVDGIAVALEPYLATAKDVPNDDLTTIADTLLRGSATATDALPHVLAALRASLCTTDVARDAFTALIDALSPTDESTGDVDDESFLDDDPIDDEPLWCIDCAETVAAYNESRCRPCLTAYNTGTCPPDLDRITVTPMNGYGSHRWEVITENAGTDDTVVDGWDAAHTTFVTVATNLANGHIDAAWWAEVAAWVADLEMPYAVRATSPSGVAVSVRTTDRSTPLTDPPLDTAMRRRAVRAIRVVGGVDAISKAAAGHFLDGTHGDEPSEDVAVVRDAYLDGAASAAAVAALARGLAGPLVTVTVTGDTVGILDGRSGVNVHATAGTWNVASRGEAATLSATDVDTGLRGDHRDALSVARRLLAALHGDV